MSCVQCLAQSMKSRSYSKQRDPSKAYAFGPVYEESLEPYSKQRQSLENAPEVEGERPA